MQLTPSIVETAPVSHQRPVPEQVLLQKNPIVAAFLVMDPALLDGFNHLPFPTSAAAGSRHRAPGSGGTGGQGEPVPRQKALAKSATGRHIEGEGSTFMHQPADSYAVDDDRITRKPVNTFSCPSSVVLRVIRYKFGTHGGYEGFGLFHHLTRIVQLDLITLVVGYIAEGLRVFQQTAHFLW